MPDSKITALTALTAADPAVDMFPVVDVSDTTMAASGTTKRISINNILACSPAATLASLNVTGSSIPANGLYLPTTNTLEFAANSLAQYRIAPLGVFSWYDGAGGTRMTLNATGLGVGASPSYKLEVVAPAGDNIVSTFRSGDATATNNAGGGFRSISSATAASRVAQVWLDADGANFSGGDYFFIQKNGGSGTVEFNQSSNAAMVFLTNSTERMRIDSSGNLGIGVQPSAGKGCLQLSSGINFPATQVASTDANTLDDYEEGTWTGTLKGSVSDPTTPVTATGRYTKVGRLVSLQISFSNVDTTGASGDAYISGIPFTNANISVTGSVASFLALTFSGTLNSEIDSGGTNVSLFDVRSNNTWTSAQHNAGTSRYIIAGITYTV